MSAVRESTMTAVEASTRRPEAEPRDASALLLDVVFSSTADLFSLPDPVELGKRYRSAEPYPHVVIDDFLKPHVMEAVTRELVGENVDFSKVFTDHFQKNKTISTGDDVPALISLLASKFASSDMLRYFERVTGLARLMPDPHYNTDYGYYHIVGSGGVLGSHVDHSHHNTLHIPHVLNIVLYLTKDWDERHGGTLCLFDASGKNVVTRIPCRQNRLAIFACTPTAYHGVEPVAADCRRRRHSLYFAYYTPTGAAANDSVETFPQGTGSSNTEAGVNYGTYFVVPFHQLFRPANWQHLRTRLIYGAHLVLPPILVRGVKRVLRAFR